MAERWTHILKTYLQRSQQTLLLSHWEIKVSEDPVDDPADFANIRPDDRSNTATLRLGDEFWRAKDPDRKRVIAHELAHLHAYRTTDYVSRLKTHIAPATWDLFWEEFERKEDEMIEELAKLFAPMMPKLPRLTRARKR